MRSRSRPLTFDPQGRAPVPRRPEQQFANGEGQRPVGRHIGDLLVAQGLIAQGQLEEALVCPGS